MKHWNLAWVLVCLPAGLAAAQPPSPDQAIRKYLTDQAVELERSFLPGINTATDFEKARPGLRAAALSTTVVRTDAHSPGLQFRSVPGDF